MEDRVINRSSKRITQKYKPLTHKGLDLGWSRNEEDNKVYANCYGNVYEIQDGLDNIKGAKGVKSWGNYVYIKHPNGMFTRYAHLQKGIPVKKGQNVDENTIVGIMGDSGKTTARHLHFEVAKGYFSSKRINPEPYLKKPVYFESKEDINVLYQTYDNTKKKFLPIVINDNSYAGNRNHTIGGIKAKISDNSIIRIRSHIKNGKWLSEVTKCDNTSNGYSGIKGKAIDGIAIKSDNHKIKYRVHLLKENRWLDWVSDYNINDLKTGMAGNLGSEIDEIQIKIA